jgi:DNA-binding transcriptional LysR family regulator
MKPTVYIETSVVGYLTSWPQETVTFAGHQYTTRVWWSTAAQRFELFVSQLVVRECSDGDADAVRERLRSIRGISLIPITPAAEVLAGALIRGHAVPEDYPNDALHIALAACHRVQYLVSWNFRHIVNASIRPAIERACRDAGYDPPIICTPEELLELNNDQ